LLAVVITVTQHQTSEHKTTQQIKKRRSQLQCKSLAQDFAGRGAVAQSPILVTTITLERLRKRGYEAMLTVYGKMAPHLNEPSRPWRDGVRGGS